MTLLRTTTTLALVLATVWVAGCASKPIEEVPDFQKSASLTLPVAVLADTQFHESRGMPHRFFGKGGDEFVPVTVRTAQQVIGTGDLLLTALDRVRSKQLVLHVGDAIDVSCETEWAQFTRTMAIGRGQAGPDNWLFTPGNHDGFLVGNLITSEAASRRYGDWRRTCNAGQVFVGTEVRHDLFSKNQVIADYLKELAPFTAASPDRSRGCTTDRSYCWHQVLFPNEQWRSFLVQMVRLPAAAGASVPVYALMLDSSDFLGPTLLAGAQGNISTDQMQAAMSLLQQLPVDSRFFFMAHHPINAWYKQHEQMQRWTELVAHPRSLRFIVTAHTHEGGWFTHRFGNRDLVELNIGSLNDWPIYLRELEFAVDAENRVGVLAPTIDFGGDVQACPRMLPRDGSGYSVEDQRPRRESATQSEFKRFWQAAASSAELIREWHAAKHLELNPQLLAYADIVVATMPADQTFTYQPHGAAGTTTTQLGGSAGVTETRVGGAAVAALMREKAACSGSSGPCSDVVKGNLLLAVESYYWDPATPQAVRSNAHRLRYCAALQASEESAKRPPSQWEGIKNVIKRSERNAALLDAVLER